MNWDEKNTQTYDASAAKLAEYFAGIGPRTKDIEKAFSLANGNINPYVVEIGCGDGRDAKEITKLTDNYVGFDPSSKLLEIAKNKVPNAVFKQSDAQTFVYPENVDVVFAFASLLHVDKDTMATIFRKVHQALSDGGVLYISLKERSSYEAEVKKDKFGERLFYYYSPEIIKSISGDLFRIAFEDHQTIGSTDWFTIALVK